MTETGATDVDGKLNRYLAALQAAGLRLTGPRAAICAYLAATDRHPTPYQVYDDLSRSHPELSRATVYNTLNTLQALGAIVELSFGADHTHYDTDPTPHVNLICLRCHSIADCHPAAPTEPAHPQSADSQSPGPQNSGPLAALKAQVGAAEGFRALAMRADILGICAACQARGAAPDAPAPTP